MPKWEELFLLLFLVGGFIYCLLPFVTTENPSLSSCLMDVSLLPASPMIVPSKMLLKVSIIQRTFSREEGKADTRGLRCVVHGQGKWHFWSPVASNSARSESQGVRREDSGERTFPQIASVTPGSRVRQWLGGMDAQEMSCEPPCLGLPVKR